MDATKGMETRCACQASAQPLRLFWRWATWKVFEDGDPSRVEGCGTDRKGIVSFITVAGFLNGPGFQRMRAELRRHTDEIWIVDCSPEGHQPEVRTRIFQDVQQPVCIVMALRSTDTGSSSPARVRYRSLPSGHREEKFAALGAVTLDDEGWTECPTDSRDPFLPGVAGMWAEFVPLKDLFTYNGSGVMPGRTWVIAPDQVSLTRRWQRLQSEDNPAAKEILFHPHLVKGKLGDKLRQQGASARTLWSRISSWPCRVRYEGCYPTYEICSPVLRSAMDHP